MNPNQIVSTTNGIDLSLAISLVALVLSVVSPVISSIISGAFQIWKKKIEVKADKEKREQRFYEQHRVEVIERYIRAVGKACRMGTAANFDEFGASMGEIYLYVSEKHWDLLNSIATKLDRQKFMNPSEEFTELCKALSNEGVRSLKKD